MRYRHRPREGYRGRDQRKRGWRGELEGGGEICGREAEIGGFERWVYGGFWIWVPNFRVLIERGWSGDTWLSDVACPVGCVPTREMIWEPNSTIGLQYPNSSFLLWWRFSATSDRMVDPHHKRSRAWGVCVNKSNAHNRKTETQDFLRGNSNREKTTGRRKDFTITELLDWMPMIMGEICTLCLW